MMRTEAVERGLADITAATEVLDTARATTARRVEELLVGWRGDAATSFATAYDAWASAAGEVRTLLESLRCDVVQARGLLAEVDETVRADVAHLDERLG